MLGKCPVCGDTSITKIRYSKCKTTIEGNLTYVFRLTSEQKYLLMYLLSVKEI